MGTVLEFRRRGERLAEWEVHWASCLDCIRLERPCAEMARRWPEQYERLTGLYEASLWGDQGEPAGCWWDAGHREQVVFEFSDGGETKACWSCAHRAESRGEGRVVG